MRKNIKKMIPYIILILVALTFVFIGTISLIKENNKIKSYKQTVGTILTKFDCLEDECKASYSYEINGETYYVLNKKYSTYFSNKEIVYYNPENPEEAIIKSFNNIFFIMSGSTILFVLCIIYIIKNKIIKSNH